MDMCVSAGNTHLSFGEPLKPIADSEHLVTLRDAHPDRRSDRGVHTGRRGADVQDRHIEVALTMRGKTFKVNTGERKILHR